MLRKHTFIIAEIGVNHNGHMSKARKLIDAAIEAKADAVKFQTFKADKIVSINAEKAGYQKKRTDIQESQYAMIKRLELSEADHKELIKYCNNKNIIFLSSPFDLDSIDLLNDLGLELFKIPSGEITNLPYLEAIGKLNKKVIMSTGMADLDEVGDALEILIRCGTKKENITVLHANTEYPTPMQDVNLRAMLTIQETYQIKVGYSDHTSGIEIPIAAVSLGAEVLEKHLTLDRNAEGPDHQSSLEPSQFKYMVKAIRNIEEALGSNIKQPSPSEKSNKLIVRKSIVANTSINKGDVFTNKNLGIKRPGSGISPMQWYELLGQIAKHNFSKDELIEL